MDEPDVTGTTRRAFVELVLGWCSAVFASMAAMTAGARFLIPNVLYEADRQYRGLSPDAYREGTTFLPELRVFLLKNGNTFRAVSAVCTHLGCTVDADASGNGFKCPCHGSVFDENGAVVHGPAPKPLVWHPVALSRDRRVVIDAGRSTNPEHYLVV